jgi:ketosteroid isomerase-like protein
MDAVATAHAVFDALDARDFDRFQAFFMPDAVIWHNFDNSEYTIPETAQILGAHMANMKENRYADRRYIAAPGGAVCQHVVRSKTHSGDSIELHSMMRMFVENGRIRRIEEYFEPAQATRPLPTTAATTPI